MRKKCVYNCASRPSSRKIQRMRRRCFTGAKLSRVLKITQIYGSTRPYLDILGPHVLRLIVFWRHPLWKPQEAFWIREASPATFWSDEDLKRLCEITDAMMPEEVMQAFPIRTWEGLKLYAFKHQHLGANYKFFTRARSRNP